MAKHTDEDKHRSRQATIRRIMLPNRPKYSGGADWLGYGARRDLDGNARVNDLLLDGATKEELLKYRKTSGSLSGHYNSLKEKHGLKVKLYPDGKYRFDRSDLGLDDSIPSPSETANKGRVAPSAPTLEATTSTTAPDDESLVEQVVPKEEHPSGVLEPVTLPRMAADEAASDEDESGEGYTPTNSDRRSWAERVICLRRGQAKFRNALRKRYGDCCIITGCEVLDVVEAAHLHPYCGEEDNDPTNGLLLRADIHTLFDLDLLGIEPTEFWVELHPSVKKDYPKLHGSRLKFKNENRPSPQVLHDRYQQFRRRLPGPS